MMKYISSLFNIVRCTGENLFQSNKPANECTIYILKLVENKWYIGRTRNSIMNRYTQHLNGSGSMWTRKYKPLNLYKYFNGDLYDEDKYTKIYMAEYGIDNVRGGTYCQLELSTEQKRCLQREIWGVQDKCYLCGGNHFVKNCDK